MKVTILWIGIMLFLIVLFSPTILGFMTGNHWYNLLYIISWLPAQMIGLIFEMITDSL